MKKYDPREELASRDIVARAIDSEMKIWGDDYVLLDCTSVGESQFKEEFPNIYQKCLKSNIDIMSRHSSSTRCSLCLAVGL